MQTKLSNPQIHLLSQLVDIIQLAYSPVIEKHFDPDEIQQLGHVLYDHCHAHPLPKGGA